MARINISVGRKTTSDPLDAAYVTEMNAAMKVIQDNFKEVLKGTNKLLPKALEHAVRPIFDESQRLVPVDTGALKASGFLRSSQTTRGARVFLGYGKGGHPDYTVFVHERLNVRHAAPTQAKFLEAAILSNLSQVLPRAQAFMKSAIGI